MELSRRRLVVTAALGLATTGCSADHTSGSSSAPSSAPSSASPSATGSPSPSHPTPTLPSVTLWQPSTNDIEPACKVAAVRHVERAGTSASSAVEVIDAQYGGYLSTSASVLVVTRSWRRAGDVVRKDGHTFDVRLSKRGSRWRVTAVHPSTPGAPASRLTAAARRVLASDRIDLPPAGRADVLSGQVHDSVLTAMLTVAASHRIGVSVVRSGHPIYVFGTSRLSDHPQGRAFDTWRIDGHAVVDARTPKSLVTDYMHAVADAGSYNVGGPYLLGAAPQWFSDDTHHDHVHAGFAS